MRVTSSSADGRDGDPVVGRPLDAFAWLVSQGFSPDNKFIIVSLRGDYSHPGTSPRDQSADIMCDSLVSYAIDTDTGLLRIVDSANSGWSIPRHLSLNKAGDLVAVVAQRDGRVSVLVRDPGSGKTGGVVASRDGFGGDLTGFHGSLRGPVNAIWDE
ncbi:hypothetical protein PRZ48_005469 [Zasmidium cellare]|uniref:Uncharacterized protein n=1 Tax=Zasmidium cellare TaxID=395010 RepID=A0ABR0ETZ9_ZASCE|nr:hypothetical protein PRZ48_005469 [Zasmidium cellare]